MSATKTFCHASAPAIAGPEAFCFSCVRLSITVNATTQEHREGFSYNLAQTSTLTQGITD